MSDIEKVAWRWYVINYELSEFGKNNKNYYLLRYEDVFNSRRDGLKKILNILDLTMNEKQIEFRLYYFKYVVHIYTVNV